MSSIEQMTPGIDFSQLRDTDQLTPQEIARHTKRSVATIIRRFKSEPGVIVDGKEPGRYGRTHHTIRIPVWVFRRWERSRQVPPPAHGRELA